LFLFQVATEESKVDISNAPSASLVTDYLRWQELCEGEIYELASIMNYIRANLALDLKLVFIRAFLSSNMTL